MKLIDDLLTDAGVSMDTFLTRVLGDKIDYIERIDRLTATAETRRNAALREIDRRGAVSSAERCDAACTRSRTTTARTAS